jgi:hypothetical protein
MFRVGCLEEPRLEFGDGGLHIDSRAGLISYGPLQPMVGDVIRVGVIGTGETIAGFSAFLDRCREGIPGKRDDRANLFPAFPGLQNRNPFRCGFVTDDTLQRPIPSVDVRRIVAVPRHADAVRAAVDLFAEQTRVLFEGSSRPDVVVVALPIDLLGKLVNGRSEGGLADDEDHDDPMNFRDMYKARALLLNAPTQIVWPTLWDDNARIPRKLKNTLRTVQDPATRAWNLLNALFHKAGRAPWRLPTQEGEYKATFLGIGFYKDLGGRRLMTGTAQMFDERGRGLILRGGKALHDKDDRHPYLERGDAYRLVERSLEEYRRQHLHMPARLVVLKTARFDAGEGDGVMQAAADKGVGLCDLVWVSENPHQMLMREGDYPPLRGTTVELGRDLMIYTKGSVPYYRTWPGQRAPNPLLLRPHSCDTSIAQIGEEVLGLTKLNWNTTQFDQALPIPIRAARQVGKVLKHVSEAQVERSDYRFYI